MSQPSEEQRVEEIMKEQCKNKEPSLMAVLASQIAAETVRTATTDEERARGQRETNAANALARGDIAGAFRSMSYFHDR